MKFISIFLMLFQVQNALSQGSNQDVDPNLAVYPGCSLPPKIYGRTLLIDSASGDSLQRAINEKRVLPGDRVMLRGPQGALRMSRYSHPEWVHSKEFLKIVGYNASFSSIYLMNMSKIHFERVNVAQDSGQLVNLRNSEDIIFSGSSFKGGDDTSSWDAKRWMSATRGFLNDNSPCVSVTYSKFMNLREGIFFITRGKTVDDVSMRGLIKKNELRNISSDFIRPVGSDIIVQGNRGFDGYVDDADGDANHDDFIQGYALNGVPHDNVKIIDNYFQEYTNSDRKYKAAYQGISVFDGEYNNLVIRGNTVVGGAYNGIAVLGGNNVLIENNTVLSNYPDSRRSFWIRSAPTKTGLPATNVIIRNNFANYIFTKGVSHSNNGVAAPSKVGDLVRRFSTDDFKYDLRFKWGTPFYGKGIGDATPW